MNFRIHEGVDTSYAKFQRKPEPIDDNPFDKVVPPADLLYTSNRGGTISVDVNGKNATGPLEIPSTNDPADPVAWRQWHHWNLVSQLLRVHLDKGRNVLTVRILTKGNVNLAYFDFKQVKN